MFVALATAVAFAPVLGAGFVAWDDDKNFLENTHYRGLGPAQLSWMWTTFHLGHYVPLSWMSLGLDYRLWGMNAAGYHATNLVLHAANAVLLFYIARRVLRMTGNIEPSPRRDAAAACAALVFAVHPLRVESVAWITERRDVLSGFFVLASVLCYLRALDAGAGRRWYLLSVAAFAAALLSKATAVTLPAVLLVINIYPLRRLGRPGGAGWWTPAARRVYAELAPYALLALSTVVMTFVAPSST